MTKGFLAANFTVELRENRQPRSGSPVARMKASVLCLAGMKHAKTNKPAEQQLQNFRIIKYFKMGKAESYQAILFLC